jgi:colanic acid biosynthesis glycosyl transferase WcaI
MASFAFSSLPALIAQLRWRPALVMCIAPAMLNAPFALAFARLSGAKAWLHIQDFELDAALKLGLVRGGQWLARLSARLERALLLGFDMVSTISGTMLRRLHEKGLPQNKTFLFRNWVDTRQIFPLEEDDNPLRAGLGLASGQLAVLYAGAIGRKQGLENLLAAAGRLQDRPQLQFIVCGDGAARPEIEAAARGMSNIHFLPVQPAERLNRLLNLADIHVLPQKASAADLVMPSKLGGMLASGKAVIATACSKTELGQIVGQVGETVPPEDAESLAEAIASLANEPAKRQRLGMLGRKYACDHLEKEVVLSALEGAFEGLLADRARAQCPRIGQLTPSI